MSRVCWCVGTGAVFHIAIANSRECPRSYNAPPPAIFERQQRHLTGVFSISHCKAVKAMTTLKQVLYKSTHGNALGTLHFCFLNQLYISVSPRLRPAVVDAITANANQGRI